MKSNWKEWFEQAAWEFQELNALTRKSPVSEWTLGYDPVAPNGGSPEQTGPRPALQRGAHTPKM